MITLPDTGLLVARWHIHKKNTDFANYFNDIFIGKTSKLRDDMPATNADTTHPSIFDQIMKDKNCTFEFLKVSVEEVKNIVVYHQ